MEGPIFGKHTKKSKFVKQTLKPNVSAVYGRLSFRVALALLTKQISLLEVLCDLFWEFSCVSVQLCWNRCSYQTGSCCRNLFGEWAYTYHVFSTSGFGKCASCFQVCFPPRSGNSIRHRSVATGWCFLFHQNNCPIRTQRGSVMASILIYIYIYI